MTAMWGKLPGWLLEKKPVLRNAIPPTVVSSHPANFAQILKTKLQR